MSGLDMDAKECVCGHGLLLGRLDFSDKSVLELGCGSEGCSKIVLSKGGRRYTGVDIDPTRIEVANIRISAIGIKNARFVCEEAAEFCRKNISRKFDIILAINFFDCIPLEQTKHILPMLSNLMMPHGILVVDGSILLRSNPYCTPKMRQEIALDSSRNFMSAPEWVNFFASHGFYNITQHQVYMRQTGAGACGLTPLVPFATRWCAAHAAGFPLKETYCPDTTTYYPSMPELPEWGTVNSPLFSDIQFLLTKGFRDAFAKSHNDDVMLGAIRSKVQSGSEVVFDVGGFVGFYTLSTASILGDGGKVVCFEPNVWNQQIILEHISVNNQFQHKTLLYPFALGDENNDVEMFLSDNYMLGFSSTSQLMKSDGTINNEDYLKSLNFYKTHVPQITMDRFVEETKLVPDIVKIDVEGAEFLVLKGALKTLCSYGPKLFIELHAELQTFSCLQLLRESGYQVKLLFVQKEQSIIHVYAKKTRESTLEHMTKTANELSAQINDVKNLAQSLRPECGVRESALELAVSSRREICSREAETVSYERGRMIGSRCKRVASENLNRCRKWLYCRKSKTKETMQRYARYFLLVMFHVLLRLARMHPSAKHVLSKTGWQSVAVSTSDKNAFIVCNPSSSSNPYATLKDEVLFLRGPGTRFVRFLYRFMIMLAPYIPKQHAATIRTDVYIMF